MDAPLKLLLLTDLFPPHFAPRMAYFASYLHNHGWDVTVVTEQIPAGRAQAHDTLFPDSFPGKVLRLPLVSGQGSPLGSLKDALFQSKSKRLQHYLKKELSPAAFHLVLAFSYRTFPLPAAAWIARKYHLPVWMDCRDLVEQYPLKDILPGRPLARMGCLERPLLRFLRRKFVKARTRALQSAQAISTVSPWHKDLLRSIHPGASVDLLPNGFDETLFVPEPPVHSDRFRIIFTGRVLSLQMRDPSLLFDALEQEPLRAQLQKGVIEIAWYTDAHSQRLLTQALAGRTPALRQANTFYAMIPFTEMPRLLRSASVVLLLGNREEAEDAPHGMIGTKTFEAMAMRRPILFTRSDDGSLASLLEPYGAACCAGTQAAVSEFLTRQLADWRAHSGVTLPAGGNVNASYAASFARERVADSLCRHLRLMLYNHRTRAGIPDDLFRKKSDSSASEAETVPHKKSDSRESEAE